jgi:hypothetical protein
VTGLIHITQLFVREFKKQNSGVSVSHRCCQVILTT